MNNPKKACVIPLPDKLESVPIVYAFPGATRNYLDGFIDKFKGIIVVSYGSGNVSEEMYYAIKNVIACEMKVVLVAHCNYGGVFSEHGSNQSLQDIGVIMAHDLTPFQVS
jgi:L-asparaginase/Glu-tRNA(Gln) amidotransferase subunit D